jgi:hypothetical protein
MFRGLLTLTVSRNWEKFHGYYRPLLPQNTINEIIKARWMATPMEILWRCHAMELYFPVDEIEAEAIQFGRIYKYSIFQDRNGGESSFMSKGQESIWSTD